MIDLIPGGSITVILAAVATALLGAWKIYSMGQKSGSDNEKSKQADSYAKHLEDIGKAADARNRIQPSDSLPEHDPYRRD